MEYEFGSVVDITTIEQLDAVGFTGSDASLETSLREYGLAHKRSDDGEEVHFIYGLRVRKSEYGGMEYMAFEHAVLDANINDFNHLNIAPVATMCGMSMDEFYAMAFEQQISDIIAYYGVENVFNDAMHSEGFKLS